MPEEIITRDSAAFKELYRDIVKAIRAVDILIDTHRPTIGNELYLTSEEICSIFSISKPLYYSWWKDSLSTVLAL